MRIKWRNALDCWTCLKIFSNNCRHTSQTVPKIPSPYNSFPLSVGRTCDNDGVSLPRVAWKKFARQSLRDFANVIKVSNQLILSPSKGILSSLSLTLSGELLRKSKGSEG